ncbi:circadian clock protein LdpA [Spirulina sp. 06S082]|uniref:circadian clock protein LdpA n=1 Tax=Spirulina sp. 06S082 TaxID=3110248 RepID=UPI002B1F96BA|nr:LdpA C-terminal domain-containing domain [Spirulina sp. 06S082]MEA5472092.1 LdpA C-terminal domain-containing domain [Spirulina sp. 06S082]
MIELYSPLDSLKSGRWFKLICGASFQHLPAIRSLALAYTLAGVDCVDVAADPAVIEAAKEGFAIARQIADAANQGNRPWLMVSLNDGEDPHFRKAEFDATQCPSDCPAPCEKVCPTDAIAFSEMVSGVIDARCYGCGRCLSACPENLIFARSRVSTPETILPLILQPEIDALEIHTQAGNFRHFQRLWKEIAPRSDRLKLLAISCPDSPDLLDYLASLYELISPLSCPLVWQTDGRPMSGDLGKSTTYPAIALAQKVLNSGLPGYIQLAGGTNQHTVSVLKKKGLLGRVAGVAYGSYSRKQLTPLLDRLEAQSLADGNKPYLECYPDLLWQTVALARESISQIKPSLSS